jgi:Ribonuclease G/E
MNWTKKVWRKIRDFYDNMKLETEEKIQEIENRRSTTTPSDSSKTKTKTKTVPTLRRDTISPELEDTMPIDTSGGYIDA